MEGDPIDLAGGDRGRGERAAGGWGMGEGGSGDDGRAREMDDLGGDESNFGSPFGRSP